MGPEAKEMARSQRHPDRPGPVVDAHFHLWDLERLPYPWLAPDAPPRPFGDHRPIKSTYTPERYRADWRGVDIVACVHVQANCANPRGETQWLADCAARTGIPSAIVAYADLAADDVEATLEETAAEPLVRGIRMMLNWHDEPVRRAASRFDLMEDERFRRGFRLLARHGLSFDLGCLPAQLPMASRLAGDHPDTLIVLNHLGWPLLGDPDGEGTWRRGLRDLARHPNVRLKISGLWPVDQAWAVEILRPFVREALDLFGFDRCMYGSNFPIEKMMTTIPHQVSALQAIVADASPAERDLLFSTTARLAYRLPHQAEETPLHAAAPIHEAAS
ncbi:amidohydrolase family protein [Alsobacter sp. R-9]